MITVMHLISGLETGGAERMLARLVTRADPARCRSLVVSLGKTGPAAAPIEKAGIVCAGLGMNLRAPMPGGLVRLVKLLRRERPDILQTWLYHADFFGLLAARLAPVPALLWNLRCSDMQLRALPAALRLLLARLSAIPDAVIVNSQAGRRFHESIGYRPRRWEYLPNGFDTAELASDGEARARLRAGLGLDDEAIAIGLPARFHPMKDHASFLAAAKILAIREPQARFVLIGAGTEAANPRFASLLAQSGIAARVLALGERRDMPAVYAGLDIATLCSQSGEGFPNALGEAMACGTPCVATDIGDAADLVGDTGLVVPRRDPAALAAAWQALIAEGPKARRIRGLMARARIRRDYELDAVVGRYLSLYEELAAARRAPASTGARPARAA